MTSSGRAAHGANWSGYLLGFALGGFFDGILLHQILQWHHLLSGLEEARQDIRLLVLTDGLFHLLMYGVAAAGLWLLWRERRAVAAGDAFHLPSRALVGFGSWHVVDAVVSHWLLGIHRVRMDVDNPLFWDLLWLAAFGVAPLAIGIALLRKSTSRRALLSSPLALALATLVSGGVALFPAPSDGPVMVLFRPGTTPHQAMQATKAVGAQLMWTDPSQELWAVKLSEGSDANGFYAYGAIMVSNSILPAGCLDFVLADIKTAASPDAAT